MPVNPDFTPRLMKAKAAAHYLGISPSKLRALALPVRRAGGNLLYERADLDAWADALPYDGPQEGTDDCNAADTAWNVS